MNWPPLVSIWFLRFLLHCAPLRTYTIQPWHSSDYYSNNNTIGHNTSWLGPSPTTILCFYAAGHVKNNRFNASLLILCWPVAIINNNKIHHDVDKDLRPPPMTINCHRYCCHQHNYQQHRRIIILRPLLMHHYLKESHLLPTIIQLIIFHQPDDADKDRPLLRWY